MSEPDEPDEPNDDGNGYDYDDERRSVPVSFKVRRVTHKSCKKIANEYDMSFTDLIEWYPDELVALYDANRLSPTFRRKRNLALVALDDATFAEAEIRASRGKLSLGEWIRRRVEEATKSQVEPSPVTDPTAPPISPAAWEQVVAAVTAALTNGEDAVRVFFQTFPWKDVPTGVSVDDAALLHAALAAADAVAVYRERARRELRGNP
jgi:hypothetical protein